MIWHNDGITQQCNNQQNMHTLLTSRTSSLPPNSYDYIGPNTSGKAPTAHFLLGCNHFPPHMEREIKPNYPDFPLIMKFNNVLD